MKDTSGPAFPSKGFKMIETGRSPYKERQEDYIPGMSQRMWLAGLAMQGLIQNPNPALVKGPDKQYIVTAAYELADAMLEEGAK